MMHKHHLAEDTIDRRDMNALIKWLRGYPRLTKGPLTVEFEQKWNRWIGSRYSVFCNSGSSANLLMYYVLKASGRLKNTKVIVPSVGWVTSIAPAIQFGFEPYMCEADPGTYGLELNCLEHLLKKHRPATVVLVQVLGVPHRMDEMMTLKKKYGFFLLEDTCAAIGARYKGRYVGTFGDMASFSFYFGHQMSTVEGGMVSTNDRQFNDLLLMLRSHGWSKDLSRASHNRLVRKYRVDDFHSPFMFYEPGFNLRASDINAFLGLGQIKKLDWIISRREENHARYLRRLGGRLGFQTAPPGSRVCSISFGALARNIRERHEIVSALVDAEIETRIFSAGNLGLHPFWYNRYGRSHFPVADRIHTCGFFLPNHPTLKTTDVDWISSVVLGAMG